MRGAFVALLLDDRGHQVERRYTDLRAQAKARAIAWHRQHSESYDLQNTHMIQEEP